MMYKGNVLITGVSTGIGYHCAQYFIKEGYRVLGSVRKEADAKECRSSLGVAFYPLIFDVTDEAQILKGYEDSKSILGQEGLSLLVNNAGISIAGPTTLLEKTDYQRQFEVNLFGMFSVTKTFLPLLGATELPTFPPGKIFNISSVAGQLVYPFMGPYSASKFAVEGFSHALRRELLLYGIDVVILGPGPIKTPIWEKNEDISEETLDSPYGKQLQYFQRRMTKAGENGKAPEEFARRLFEIFMKKNPRTRYSITERKFSTWTIPRYFMSDRSLDKIVQKMFRLFPKNDSN